MPVTQADRVAEARKMLLDAVSGHETSRFVKGKVDITAAIDAIAAALARAEVALDEAAGVVRELADIARSTFDQTVDASYIDRVAQRVEYLKVKPAPPILVGDTRPFAHQLELRRKANPHD